MAQETETPGPKVMDFSCSFCGRGRREVNRLVSGPLVFICNECHASAQGLRQQLAKCSFCGRHEDDLHGLKSEKHEAAICDGCLTLTGEILAGRK